MSTEIEQEVAVSIKSRPVQDATVSAKSAEIAKTLPMQLFSPVREPDGLLPHAWMRPLTLDCSAWSGTEDSFKNAGSPRLDVIDRDKEILIRAELPGVEKKGVDTAKISATMKNGMLEIVLPKDESVRRCAVDVK